MVMPESKSLLRSSRHRDNRLTVAASSFNAPRSVLPAKYNIVEQVCGLIFGIITCETTVCIFSNEYTTLDGLNKYASNGIFKNLDLFGDV
jgi:hypothetical protein